MTADSTKIWWLRLRHPLLPAIGASRLCVPVAEPVAVDELRRERPNAKIGGQTEVLVPRFREVRISWYQLFSVLSILVGNPPTKKGREGHYWET